MYDEETHPLEVIQQEWLRTLLGRPYYRGEVDGEFGYWPEAGPGALFAPPPPKPLASSSPSDVPRNEKIEPIEFRRYTISDVIIVTGHYKGHSMIVDHFHQ